MIVMAECLPRRGLSRLRTLMCGVTGSKVDRRGEPLMKDGNLVHILYLAY